MRDKIKFLFASLALVVFLALTGVGIYFGVEYVRDNTSSNRQTAYDQGYLDGINNEDELTKQIDYWKGLSDANYQMYVDTKFEKDELEKSNSVLNANITKLQGEKDTLQTQYDGVYADYLANEKAIQENTNTISSLNARISQLEASGTDKSNEIVSLKNQIKSLQNSNDQLTLANQNNLSTITLLNNQIVSLNGQITSLTQQVQNNAGSVNALNAKIAQLEKSIAYYEQYIEQLENGEQVVATFEVNGSVYNVQIVNKNAHVSVVNPTSTEYVIFNGWTVNGTAVDLSTYVISSNTKFVADLTFKYAVDFVVDDQTYSSQIVVKNDFVTLPTTPSKEGYDFNGWTKDGINVIDPTTIAITDSMTFIAKFTKKHTVTFMYEDTVYATQIISNGSSATSPSVDNTEYKVFNGWKLNGVITDVSTYTIYGDVIFTADITYKYLVTFKVDDEVYSTEIVTAGTYATLPQNPTKDGYMFDGWSTDGDVVIDLAATVISKNTTCIAIFHQITFANATWEYVSIVSNDIKSRNLNSLEVETKYGWKIGDEKTITMSNGENIVVLILGYNHDNKSDGAGKAGITFGMKDCLATKYKMNSSNTNVGGWSGSLMRVETMKALLSQLPADLQLLIQAVDKKTSAGNGSTNIIISSDKLWLFSEEEIRGKNGYSLSGEGSQYEYWNTVVDGNWAPNRIKKCNGSACQWCLRSPNVNSSKYFCVSGTDGGFGLSSAISDALRGVSFGFCI